MELTTKRISEEATHWSVRLMMKYARVTQWQVQQVWAAADLRPHRLKNFKISNDPRFGEKVVDVVGLYLRQPANAMVLSVDEKTQIQPWIGFLQQVVQAVPANLDLHVILDNSSTHKTPAVKEFLRAHPRVQLHFTPTSASSMRSRALSRLNSMRINQTGH